MWKVVTNFMLLDVPKCVLINKNNYQTEIMLLIYIEQYRSFELSNVTRIMRISSTDYISLITTVEDTSGYIAFRWPKFVT